MQDKIIDITWDKDIVRPRAVGFSSVCKAFGVPIIKVEHVPDKLGPTTASVAETLQGFPEVKKKSFSAFGSPDFLKELSNCGKKQIALFGVEAHICVCQTALDAVEAGYQVFVVADACSSTSAYHRDIAFERMRQAGVTVATAQSLAFELIGRADIPEFKDVLPFIKEL